MDPALDGQAGAVSASGLSWTLEHTAGRKEGGGDGRTGGWKDLSRAWPFLWEKQGCSGAPAGLCRPRCRSRGRCCGGTAARHGLGWHRRHPQPHPGCPGLGARAAWDDPSHGGLRWGWRGCLQGLCRWEGPVWGQRCRCWGAGAPDTELFPSRLRWIAGLTWEIASLPR